MSTSFVSELDPVTRLGRDLADAAKTLSLQEARYLVDAYYMMQGNRIASANQARACAQSEEPHSVIEWLAKQNERLENQIRRALDKWTDEQPLGVWCKSITGIGPVITAGLLSHIDITKAPTAGHIWRLAGLDPTQRWIGRDGAEKLVKEIKAEHGADIEPAELARIASAKVGRRAESIMRFASSDKKGGERKPTIANLTTALALRPWDSGFKTLVAYKLGESFVKTQNAEGDYYGKLYRQRKDYEIARNDRGDNAAQAAENLRTKNFGRDTEAFKHLSGGKLPPGQLHRRAVRWTVKLFLAHYHAEAYRQHYKTEPPMPYPIAMLGHVHVIPPPPARVN